MTSEQLFDQINSFAKTTVCAEFLRLYGKRYDEKGLSYDLENNLLISVRDVEKTGGLLHRSCETDSDGWPTNILFSPINTFNDLQQIYKMKTENLFQPTLLEITETALLTLKNFFESACTDQERLTKEGK